MAIAHVATEYVFSDFLLKDPNQARYRSVRTELAVDKMVTCVAVGLPLLLISLAFAQEVSVGTQISCFAPSNFSWRQAAYVDSYCWASVHTHTLPLWLHKVPASLRGHTRAQTDTCVLATVLPVHPAPGGHADLQSGIVLEVLVGAVVAIGPWLHHGGAGPMLQPSCHARQANDHRRFARRRQVLENLALLLFHSDYSLPSSQNCSDPTEGCFNYPLVEKFLTTKRFSHVLLTRYLLCRGLTLATLLCACLYLGYYLRLASLTDDFGCTLRVGLLVNDSTVPDKVQCKLIAVGVFTLLSLVNLIIFSGLIPLVIYASLRPLLCHRHAHFLETYQSLPTVSVLPTPTGQWDDLSLYLLFLEENISELKSYKYIKVLELLKKGGECSGEDFDAMGLLKTLCLVKMDTVDAKKAAAKPDQLVIHEEEPNKNNSARRNKHEDEGTVGTEMQELTPLVPGNGDVTDGKTNSGGGALRQRAM
ncbi:pannexin-1 isoform X1 [Syngnathus scovelli]|uniref:pannexin-1 isoform X1 n=1 Tax=Syngnathus scovelli TaxID=161590 RepID=UPI00210F3279|nr:pannexin-1 isoform X1 [Syngnathus scovelli]